MEQHFLKFKNGKYRALKLEEINPTHQYRLWPYWLGNNFTDKDLRILQQLGHEAALQLEEWNAGEKKMHWCSFKGSNYSYSMWGKTFIKRIWQFSFCISFFYKSLGKLKFMNTLISSYNKKVKITDSGLGEEVRIIYLGLWAALKEQGKTAMDHLTSNIFK